MQGLFFVCLQVTAAHKLVWLICAVLSQGQQYCRSAVQAIQDFSDLVAFGFSAHPRPNSATIPASSNTATPSVCALSSLLPASAPATT
jgi:hypothetical protein